jgi:hypothetical protein
MAKVLNVKIKFQVKPMTIKGSAVWEATYNFSKNNQGDKPY